MALNINPSQALNLGGQPTAYGDTFSALNLFVGADAWIYQNADGSENRGNVATDAKGWATTFPTVNGIATAVWANVFYTKIMPPGDYIVEWKGTDQLETYNNAEQIGPNKLLIRYDADYSTGESGISLIIEPNGPTDRNIDVKDIKIYKAEYADLVKHGEHFDPKWFQAIDDFRVLRTHDWQGTNFSKVTSPTVNDFSADQAFWIKDGRGMPYELIVETANQTRSDLWINIPHMATNEYMRQVAEYVKTNLDKDLRVYVEYTNEYWTTIFDQHSYLNQKGQELFPGKPFANAQAYGARTAEMTEIFKGVFGTEQSRLYPTLTLDDVMFKTGEALSVLTTTDWVRLGGKTPLEAGIKRIATDGYFSWYTPDPATAAMVDGWMANADGGFGAARDFLIDQIKNELVPNWKLGRQLADQYGLEFAVYEGGALLLNGSYENLGPARFTDFNNRFQLSAEMKQVYEYALQQWKLVGSEAFAWYSDTGRPGPWGDYGLWNAPDYTPEPRTTAIITANTQTTPWVTADTRPGSTFDNGLYDADTAKINVMTGTTLADRLYGLTGNDKISGLAGSDKLVGGEGSDRLTGDSGNDRLFGDAGSDYLYGGLGNDELYGGVDNDLLYSSAGIDFFDAGSGFDLVLYAGETVAAKVNLSDQSQNAGSALGDTLVNVERISGTSLNDFFTGNSSANTLLGAGGNDRLNGAGGADSLNGGVGSDTFVFALGQSGTSATSLDTISDYSKGAVGVGDKIDATVNLSIGGSAAGATATQASINAATGVATFLAGSGTSLTDALADITARMTAATNTSGEFAFFRVDNAGDLHLFISDGAAGVTDNDILIKLTGQTSVGTISITAGDLTILN